MDVAVASPQTDGTAGRNFRTPQACRNCRRRKAKCDGLRPTCARCRRRKENCIWPPGPSLRNTAPTVPIEETPSHALPSPGRAGSPALIQVVNSATSATSDGPPLALSKYALEIFLKQHHDLEFCSFIHKPSFMIESAHPFLISSMITLSSLYFPESVAHENGFRSVSQMTGWYLAATRRYSREESETPTVFSIQANLILALYELLSWSEALAWIHAGIAVRMAQAMRIGHEYHQRQALREREIRRRTFWACFTIDRLVAFATARPITLRARNISARLPCPAQVFAYEDEDDTVTLLDLLNPQNKTSASQLGIQSFFIVSLKLWNDMAELHVAGRRRTKLPPTDPQSAFNQREKAVERWIESLPTKFHWSPDNYRLHRGLGQGKLFITTHLLLRHSFIVAHQEYLPQSEIPFLSSGDLDSAGVPLDHKDSRLISTCLKNAEDIRIIASLLESGDEEDREYLHSTFAGIAIMSAASVNLWSKHVADDTEPINHFENFRFLSSVIKSWKSHWKVAVAWTGTLEILSKLYDFAYSSNDNTDFLEGPLESDVSASLAVEEELTPQFNNSDGDGHPDPATLHQRLYDKVRLVMLSPLELPETKRAAMRVFMSTMWQHAWTPSNIRGVGDIVSTLCGAEMTVGDIFDEEMLWE